MAYVETNGIKIKEKKRNWALVVSAISLILSIVSISLYAHALQYKLKFLTKS